MLEPVNVRVTRRRSYKDGYKYCSRCRMYIKTDEVRCPYCRIILRYNPRKKKDKEVKAVSVDEF